MIILHQLPKAWGLPNVSPFCAKLETYLRMAKVEYKVAPGNPMTAPRGRVPYVEIDGKKLGDSTVIIKELKDRFGDPLDSHLTPEQKALGLALRSLVEDRLYFLVAYLRWSDENSWQYVRAVFEKAMPPIVGPLILNRIRSGTVKDFYRGAGEKSREEIIAAAQEIFSALSVLLGEKEYFLGKGPSSIDAMMYGFLIQQIWVPWDGPVKQHALAQKNLVAYCERMKARYWS